jgi:outer membrane protein insertion porin family
MTASRWIFAIPIALASPAYGEEALVVVGDPAAKGTFMVGAGFSSDESFIASAKVEHPDLFGTGQGLAISLDVSKLRRQAGLVHDIPSLAGTGFQLRSELFMVDRAYDGFNRKGVGGAVTVGRHLGRSTRLYLRYRVEHVTMKLLETDPQALQAMPLGTLGDGLYATLGAGISHDTRDRTDLALRGSRVELFGEVADPRLGSDHRLSRISANLEHAHPLGPFTLRLSGHATYVRAPGGVPLSERLQHDGHGDIRGYSLGSLGSMLGPDAGANLEALGRIELEVPLIKRAGLSLAGFFDAGLRYNEDRAWGPVGGDLYRSVGVSLIWRSPIGALRFDVAFPLDGDRDRQFLFGIGVPF